MSPPPTTTAHLRIARPTPSIPALLPFYTTALGFTILYEFHNHDGFDGLILGHEKAGYHLEFTTKIDGGEKEGRAPTQENLLVFYLPGEEEWMEAVGRMEAAGFEAVKAVNGYWEVNGRTYEDPDGWRVVLQKAGWDNAMVRGRWLESQGN